MEREVDMSGYITKEGVTLTPSMWDIDWDEFIKNRKMYSTSIWITRKKPTKGFLKRYITKNQKINVS